MDLSKLDTVQSSSRGADLLVRHPTKDEVLVDEKTGEAVSIHLLGQDSTEFRKAEHDQQTRRVERVTRRGRVEQTGEEIDMDSVELMSLMTKSWKHIVLNGEALECNPHNARRIYVEFPWLREQVNRFISNRANFLGN